MRGGDGAEVIYALRNTDKFPNLVLSNLENKGQNIRKAYQRKLPSNPSKDYYFMLRNTGNTDAYIIEYGFLDSKQDDVNQLKNNSVDYAEAVVEAIAEYLNIPYGNENINYVVKKGDSLWSIAKKFSTSVNEIKNLNNLSTNLLTIGMNLKISPFEDYLYTVKRGDTLYSIAKANNKTIDEIKQLNNLQTDNISLGQKLIIKENNNTYIVKPGDTLYSIAREYNKTVDEIKMINNLKNNLLSIGQELII